MASGPLHQAAQSLLIRRCRQQIQLIRQQYVGVDRYLELFRSITQPTQENAAIRIIAENRLPIVAELNYMMDLMRDNQTR